MTLFTTYLSSCINWSSFEGNGIWSSPVWSYNGHSVWVDDLRQKPWLVAKAFLLLLLLIHCWDRATPHFLTLFLLLFLFTPLLSFLLTHLTTWMRSHARVSRPPFPTLLLLLPAKSKKVKMNFKLESLHLSEERHWLPDSSSQIRLREARLEETRGDIVRLFLFFSWKSVLEGVGESFEFSSLTREPK